VREVLPALLRAGRATAEEAARRLDVSLRTLSRQLSAEGSSFRALLTETRRALATEWLRVVPIAEVAERLGYADTRAFDRAFKQWTGMTPAGWRGRR
jgi:AraC-like DNA-binding protein